MALLFEAAVKPRIDNGINHLLWRRRRAYSRSSTANGDRQQAEADVEKVMPSNCLRSEKFHFESGAPLRS